MQKTKSSFSYKMMKPLNLIYILASGDIRGVASVGKKCV